MVECTGESSAVMVLHSVLSFGPRGKGEEGACRGEFACITLEESKLSPMLL